MSDTCKPFNKWMKALLTIHHQPNYGNKESSEPETASYCASIAIFSEHYDVSE